MTFNIFVLSKMNNSTFAVRSFFCNLFISRLCYLFNQCYTSKPQCDSNYYSNYRLNTYNNPSWTTDGTNLIVQANEEGCYEIDVTFRYTTSSVVSDTVAVTIFFGLSQ